MHFDIVLSPRDPAELHSLALAVSTPGSRDRGHFLTVPQFASRFGRTRASLRAARAALHGVGLAPRPATPNGLIIPVFTTVRQAAASLHTSFVNYKLSSGRVAFANTSAPRLPSALAKMTTAVIGLNDLAVAPVLPRMPVTARRHGKPAEAPASGPVACTAAVNKAAATGRVDLPATGIRILVDVALQFRLPGGKRRHDGLFELDPWSASDISSSRPVMARTSRSRASTLTVARHRAGESEAALDIETRHHAGPAGEALRIRRSPVTSVLDLDR